MQVLRSEKNEFGSGLYVGLNCVQPLRGEDDALYLAFITAANPLANLPAARGSTGAVHCKEEACTSRKVSSPWTRPVSWQCEAA